MFNKFDTSLNFNYLYKNININYKVREKGFIKNFSRFIKNKRRISLYLYIQANKRSTRITVLNKNGLVLFTISVGLLEFKKSQRKGSFSAIRLFNFFIQRFNKLNLSNSHKIVVCLKGHGPGRRPLINLLGKGPLKKKCIFLLDLTNLSYNGCRLKKQRRL
jgi:ribosomal protein S11